LASGLRFTEQRKLEDRDSWNSGYVAGSTVNNTWDEYFYGTTPQGTKGM
jgi:hypothetical protein